MMTDAYQRRLTNYLRWATMETIGPISGSVKALCAGYDSNGLSPEEAMYRWETKGERHPCNDTDKLYRYAAGKSIRDFYVSNWTKDVRDGLLVAEELVCTGGMDLEEFRAVFKRDADPWLLRRLWKESECRIDRTRTKPTLQSVATSIRASIASLFRWRPAPAKR